MVNRPDEFRRAFAVATIHDMFNLMAVAILLPLEMATGLLGRFAEWISGLITGAGGVEYHSPIKAVIKAGVKPLEALMGAVTDSHHLQAVLLIALCAVMIKISGKGPVIFRQVRSGKDGSVFTMYKLRSMYTDAESTTGAVWAKDGDSRIMPLCRWMRRSHVDELPQLIKLNIIKVEVTNLSIYLRINI